MLHSQSPKTILHMATGVEAHSGMGDEPSRPGGWRFSDGLREFRLFPEQRRLFNGDEEIDLPGNAFNLLVLFLRNAGRIIGKKQISTDVWHNYDISESSISAQVAVLRRAIGTDAIATIINHGYQFTFQVQEIEVPSLPARPVALLPSLPHLAASPVGREEELAQLTALLSQHRAVTIIGPGGVGKSWLATALGWRVAEQFPDGVFFAELAPAKTMAALAGAIAQAMHISLRSSDNPVRIIGASIDKRKALLILDGCEYVQDEARTMVQELLKLAPNLTVLITSQAALQIPKEKIFRLKPLSLDDAVTLFVESAQALDDQFEANEQTLQAAVEICRRLDCIPLTLEMAAALARRYGIERMQDRLPDRLQVLGSAKRKGDARQATLGAMLDWSHGLLDADEQRIFRRLAVFSGSFTEEAAAAVAWPDGTDEWKVAGDLVEIVDKSLLVREPGRIPRYRFLETIGLYAAAKLDESGEREAMAERHARHYVGFFERADEAWETMPDPEWVAEYGPDIDNLRAALDWALAEPSRAATALSLAGAGGHLWDRLALSADGRTYLDRVMALIDAATPPADAARVLRRAAILWRRTDRLHAVALLERSAALYRQTTDRLNLAAVLGLIGGDYIYLGRQAEAKALLGEARENLSGSSHLKSLYSVMNDLGSLALATGDADEARQCYAMARTLARQVTDATREGIGLINLGEVEFRVGAVNQAIEFARQAADGLRSANQPFYLATSLVNLASYHVLQDNAAAARDCAAEALKLVRADGGRWLRLCLQLWALLGAREGRYAAAAQLIGFVQAGFVRSGEIREGLSQRIYDGLSAILASHLAADDMRAWAEQGASWDEEQAIAFTLSRLVSSDNQ